MSVTEVAGTDLASVGAVKDGVTVTAYGQGQLSAAVFTAPAHGVTTVDFNLQMMSVTTADITKMDELIQGLLAGSMQKKYTDLKSESSSAGSSFFGWWRTSSSYQGDTSQFMQSWGLTTEQQTTIIDSMLKLANTMNEYKYKSTVQNTEYDYSVSGSLFGVVMDATIQSGTTHTQVRMLAPQAHINGSGGESLPVLTPPTIIGTPVK